MKHRYLDLALLAVLLALPVVAQSPQKDERKVAALPIVEGDPDETPKDRITIQMLRQRMADGATLLIIDSRGAGAYESSTAKITGAVRIPAGQIEAELKTGRLKAILKTTEIIAYGTSPDEATSARVTKILTDSGFRNVKALLGGFEAWAKAGFPVEPKNAAAGSQPKGKTTKRKG